jgi:ABC-2 type transport system ATP-binding protein
MFMSEYVLQTYDLTKTYSRKNAVDHMNLKIRKGDVYGFIGKNGAGKTTTIKMVVGLSAPTSGEIELFDSKNLQEGRKKIGTVIENPALYPYLSARQNIEVQRILQGVKDKSVTDELLEVVGLKNTGRKKAKNFSLGMKQRLAIALALVGDPEFLFLDEPINGLDPTGIKDVRELILKLNREVGITIMISSHILGELSKIATCYGVISDGRLVDQFTTEELKSRVKPCIRLTVNNPEKAVFVLKDRLHMSDFEVTDNSIRIYEMLDKSVEINKVLEDEEIIVQFLSKEDGDYEEYFIKLMEGVSDND